jgi:hypothetical protein
MWAGFLHERVNNYPEQVKTDKEQAKMVVSKEQFKR